MKSDYGVPYVLPYQQAALADTPLLVVTGEALLYGWNVINNVAAVSYVQIFNAAAAGDVTLGATAPTYVIGNLASSVTDRGQHRPLYFSLGIVIASTTTSTGSTAASQDVSLDYA